MKDSIARWLTVFLWMGVIFAFSSKAIVASGELQFWDFLLKKSAHVGEYLILYILVARAAYKRVGLNGAFFIALSYAFSDEIHQMFVPGRTGKISDVLMFDFTGITIGYFAARRWRWIWK